MANIALYLAGGGARGAYQAGVLKALSTILNVKKLPFTTITGVSVGSLNAAILAENTDDFPKAVAKLESLWRNIDSSQVFHASNYSLSKSVLRNVTNFLINKGPSGYILDTSPLAQFIHQHIDFDLIAANINAHKINNLEVISTCYEAQQTVSFCHAIPEFKHWQHPRHISHAVELAPHHILASSALPLFFPAACIDNLHYGDGSIGLVSPLRGAIRAQVEKILVIGTRKPSTFTSMASLKASHHTIGFAHILGGMLNSVFLDNLDRDIETVNRMNEIARLLSIWKKRHAPWRPIATLNLRPSTDVASMAQSHYNQVPALLRFILNLLGAQGSSGDLLSFLLFEQNFTEPLIALGESDTLAASDEVQAFFES
ncbi:MAG: patatin [Legionellaceae bacterium]|nr:patatin [Legionellaceae bacterium]HAF87348.1 patatin [Legionellales bacterium]HCA89270.1 patatin [Legionellales bacterium]|tara:strand:- start:213 stop:1328 length:1116 start_codon:yes stop_codon:yes gene_type:complete